MKYAWYLSLRMPTTIRERAEVKAKRATPKLLAESCPVVSKIKALAPQDRPWQVLLKLQENMEKLCPYACLCPMLLT